jgi:alkanesulfonate monooxygenase SsuD/methylene tetrahydromethanopterin reductase-like flavin-dependent oxidoreductase (luciferase family)
MVRRRVCRGGAPLEILGAQLDDLLDALLALWTTNPVEHQGHRWSIPASYVNFKPVQRPHPPIGLGAFSGDGLRRVGRRANCWLPVVWAQHGVDLEPLKAQRRLVDDAARAAGARAKRDRRARSYQRRPETPTAAVADTIRSLEDDGYPNSFVELMWAVSGAALWLQWVEQLVVG